MSDNEDDRWIAPKEKAQERYNICQSCPEIKKPLMQCSVCMCFMKVKVMLDNSECPLKKW